MAHDSTDTTGHVAAHAESRVYGAERIALDHEASRGLLSPGELRMLERVDRLGRPDRNSLYAVLDARVQHFLDDEWPLLLDVYPEYAARVREEVCRVTSDRVDDE